jgi:hypothetical protein
MRFHGITLHRSAQLWSKPSWRDQPQGLMPMLANPSFLDLLELTRHFSTDALLQANEQLLLAKEISAVRHRINESMLQNIQRGLHAH